MENYYVIGTIVSTHALKGEVKIYSTTDFKEERYKVGNKLFIERAKQMIEVKIKSYRRHKEFDLVSFENYNNINDVLELIKCKVYVHESQLQDLELDEFYYHELIDSLVYNEDNLVGKVIDVVNYGASDILIIRNEDNKEIMIPFVDEFVKEIDSKNKKIHIEVIEGLLGENHEN